MRCPVCGEDYSDAPDLAFKDVSDLSEHIFFAHGNGGCFCGAKTAADGGLMAHCNARGGYEAHWMDYLMGVSKENQLTQGD